MVSADYPALLPPRTDTVPTADALSPPFDADPLVVAGAIVLVVAAWIARPFFPAIGTAAARRSRGGGAVSQTRISGLPATLTA